jgi:acyl-[acyl carrier protein]--UDP-N-acetylglucosamine O-acyltransferase
VVAANSVVLKDVPPFCVVAGNPAQIIKMFNPQTKSWERTRTDEDRQRIFVARNAVHIPSREEYRQLIFKNANFKEVNPIVAGRGIST